MLWLMSSCWNFVDERSCCFFFFFQAEDGIRDLIVTGVQTCALPILPVIGCLVHASADEPFLAFVLELRPARIAALLLETAPAATARPGAADPTPAGIAVSDASPALDRKSTRLNSSHDQISYAVFCLKKKKKN